jgi:hypothetical protein
MVERAVGESEVLGWVSAVRRSFAPPKKELDTVDTEGDSSKVVVDLLKHQSEQIELLILQNKRSKERLQAMKAQLLEPVPGRADNTTSAHRHSTGQHLTCSSECRPSKVEGIPVTLGNLVRVIHRKATLLRVQICEDGSALRIQTRGRAHDAVLSEQVNARHQLDSVQGRNTGTRRTSSSQHHRLRQGKRVVCNRVRNRRKDPSPASEERQA